MTTESPLDTVVIEPHVGGRFACTMVEDATCIRHENKGHYLEVEEPYLLGVATEERDC